MHFLYIWLLLKVFRRWVFFQEFRTAATASRSSFEVLLGHAKGGNGVSILIMKPRDKDGWTTSAPGSDTAYLFSRTTYRCTTTSESPSIKGVTESHPQHAGNTVIGSARNHHRLIPDSTMLQLAFTSVYWQYTTASTSQSCWLAQEISFGSVSNLSDQHGSSMTQTTGSTCQRWTKRRTGQRWTPSIYHIAGNIGRN